MRRMMIDTIIPGAGNYIMAGTFLEGGQKGSFGNRARGGGWQNARKPQNRDEPNGRGRNECEEPKGEHRGRGEGVWRVAYT